MTFLEFGTPYVLMCLFGALCGFMVARKETRAQFAAEAYQLEFLALNGYSLQCLRGLNGDDDTWAVTDGSSKVIGKPAYTPREAIDSAIGHVAFEHAGDEA